MIQKTLKNGGSLKQTEIDPVRGVCLIECES